VAHLLVRRVRTYQAINVVSTSIQELDRAVATQPAPIMERLHLPGRHPEQVRSVNLSLRHNVERHLNVERRCARTEVNGDGIMFKSCGDSPYLSLNAHRAKGGTKNPKSIWNRTRPDECHTFCASEANDWTDPDTGNRWAASRRDEPPLGTRGERFAFFYGPSFEGGPWHGFPVGGRDGLRYYGRPPDEVAKSWRDMGLITYAAYSRITKGRF